MTTDQQLQDQAAIDYFDDLPPVEQEQATLEVLTRLAQESIGLTAEINSDTVALAEKQGRLDKLERVRIPEIMETLGMAEFKLTDGSTVSVKNDIKASITIANQPAAFKWLEDHHFDGIIKTNVGLAFGKGEMERAKKAVEELSKAGFDGASIDRSVHFSTLKSFVKERLEDATVKAEDALPMDIFGVFEFKVAKIKLPKSKK